MGGILPNGVEREREREMTLGKGKGHRKRDSSSLLTLAICARNVRDRRRAWDYDLQIDYMHKRRETCESVVTSSVWR